MHLWHWTGEFPIELGTSTLLNEQESSSAFEKCKYFLSNALL